MSKTHLRKIFRDILSRKGRTALVVLSIMIGVFGVTTLAGMGDLLISQLNEDLDENEIAMTHVYVVSSGGQLSLDDNQAFIDSLRALPGVQQVEGQAIYPIDWHSLGDDDFEPGSVIAFSKPFEEVQLEPISRVVEGRFPVEGQHEIAVEQRFADKHKTEIGDQIVFRGSEDTVWTIVGIVFQPYQTMTPHSTDVTNPATRPVTNIYATYADAQSIVGFPGFSSFSARYTDVETARDDLNEFISVIASETPYITVFSFIDDPEENVLVEGTATITNILNILGILAMIVSAFLVVNVINTIVVEQKRQIGVMKSLGVSRSGNFVIYAGQAFIYGVMGTILGVMLAIPAASFMAQAIAPLSGTYIQGFNVSVTGVVIGVILGLLIPVLASLIPVFNGTRVTILEAMTDLGIGVTTGTRTKMSVPSKIGVGLLALVLFPLLIIFGVIWGLMAAILWLMRKLPMPLNFQHGINNVNTKKRRLVLTVLTLTLASAAFMGVTALFASLDEAIETIFDTFDTEIQMTTQKAEDPARVQQILMENVDSIASITPGYSVSVGLEGYTAPENSFSAGDQVQAFGVDPTAGLIHFRLTSGTGWEDDPTRKGVILNRSVAENIGKKAGDTVRISIGGQTYEYEVIGVDRWPFDTIFFEWSELARIAGYTNAEGNPTPGVFNIDLKGNPDADEVADIIDEIKAVAAANGIQAVYANQPQNEEDISQFVSTFGMVFNLTSVVMAMVGAIGLLATLSMAVLERRKEIGVMRSLGARSTTIMVQFLVEGILVAIIAWLIGLPLSYLLGIGINTALELEDFFTFEYPILVALQGLFGIIVLATIASAWPSIAAARETVSDILRYQ
ncbi:MAG: ABC transporter permease [Anaerolineae bacterium]|nr:ABC transporter permease [Anaerolineae bacterium]